MSKTIRHQIDEVSGAFLLSRPIFGDARGEFSELHRVDWEDLPEFKQTNLARSIGGVARGLHYQAVKPQGKMVTCVQGSIVDFFLDMRPSSPTHGAFYQIHLKPDGQSVYVPPGCAHGYVAAGPSIVHYACTELYVAEWNRGIDMLDMFRRNNIPFLSTLQLSKQDMGWSAYGQEKSETEQ